jgi:hypothetical protein
MGGSRTKLVQLPASIGFSGNLRRFNKPNLLFFSTIEAIKFIEFANVY